MSAAKRTPADTVRLSLWMCRIYRERASEARSMTEARRLLDPSRPVVVYCWDTA